MDRRCYECGQVKALDQFPKKEQSPTRTTGMCKPCKMAYNKIWYAANKVSHVRRVNANSRRYEKESAEVIDGLKRKPCTDCKQSFDPIAMDFDHLDGASKEFNISARRGRVTMDRLLKEIAKCEVVCAVCHRLRTKKRLRSSADSEQTVSTRKVGGSNPPGGT
jgi:hypothetical protein